MVVELPALERGGGRSREKPRCVRARMTGPLPFAPQQTGHRACDPGLCPDGE